MSNQMDRLLNVVSIVCSDFGVEEPQHMIAEIRLRPTQVEFDIYRANENGDKYVDLETDTVAMETRSFEVRS